MSMNAGETSTSRIFYNGVIHTADSALARVSVLAVNNGRIAYVGDSRAEASAMLGAYAEEIDLRGLTIIPGLIDTHQHFLLQGQQLLEVDIHFKPKDEIVRAVAERASVMKPGEWILGRGWNHELWPVREWPCKEELDAVAPANPVALIRVDGHSTWVNSLALRLAGFDRNSPDTPGGEIVRNPDGELRGILVDTPAFRLREMIPPLNAAQKRFACEKAQAEMFRYGITSVGDAWQTEDDHIFFRTMYETGVLRLRIYGMMASRMRGGQPCTSVEDEPVAGLFDNRFSRRAFKVVLDGSLGSRSAWLTEEYSDRAGYRGNGRYSDEQLLTVLRSAVTKGFQLCIHAIGDAAVNQALTALERLRKEWRGPWLPHRIEHYQMASPDMVRRTLALGVIPAMQTSHALADSRMAEARLKPSSLAISYPWRDVLDSGGSIANGSDSPMDTVNPFLGFYAAVTRTPFACQHLDAAKVRMTRPEILASYTLWAARAELAEAVKGTLVPGKVADFAVLDRDIMSCPEEAIKATSVLMTVLAGETVHGIL